MVNISRQLQLLGVEDELVTTFIQNGLLERCLRFELDFQSKIVDEFNSSGITSFQRLRYRSQHVPLRFSYAGNFYAERSVWQGDCSLVSEVTEIEYYPPSPARCTVTANAGNSWFEAPAAWIGVSEDSAQSTTKLLYDPGYPQVTATAACNDGDTYPYPVFPFASDYLFLHDDEYANKYGLYFAEHWDQLRFHAGGSQNGEFFAKKSYERQRSPNPELTMHEETWIFLKHTPDAPMPECQ